jgi:hypothetical protein
MAAPPGSSGNSQAAPAPGRPRAVEPPLLAPRAARAGGGPPPHPTGRRADACARAAPPRRRCRPTSCLHVLLGGEAVLPGARPLFFTELDLHCPGPPDGASRARCTAPRPCMAGATAPKSDGRFLPCFPTPLLPHHATGPQKQPRVMISVAPAAPASQPSTGRARWPPPPRRRAAAPAPAGALSGVRRGTEGGRSLGRVPQRLAGVRGRGLHSARGGAVARRPRSGLGASGVWWRAIGAEMARYLPVARWLSVADGGSIGFGSGV